MASLSEDRGKRGKIPRVRMAKPTDRPIQLRYTCPVEGREIRISTGMTDESDANDQKQKLEAKLLLGSRRETTSAREGWRNDVVGRLPRTIHRPPPVDAAREVCD
jgi:hypothetical protein